ncbi:MAG TPA: 1-acylglycerol-3-phosphate O-acyltransferase [Steroidobacteraceae bacterium]|nr:1-acylglycerol-3-phosphate O-acyltransferase [Steroidobacteraceae bacterium]
MNAVNPQSPMDVPDGDRLERILTVVRELAAELHPDMPGVRELDADASLERDFGLDSLARVELASRIERACGRPVSGDAIAESETVRDLAHALGEAGQLSGATEARLRASAPSAPAAAAPPTPRTLVEALEWHASRQPDHTHILLLNEALAPEPITFARLRADALAVAAGLARRGIEPGEAVAIMLPTGRDFFAAFYGVLYAHAVPVPLYPPARRSQIESHLRRLAGILTSCEARMLLTFEGARRPAQLLRSLSTKLESLATVAEVSTGERLREVPAIDASETAFIQYTSGSTGQPKGVVLAHANLLANLNAMQRATGITAADTFVSWLPLYHDMGLIGACFGALVFGFPLVLMSPFTFLWHPVRWLRAIDRHCATITAAPNFAYEMCIGKVSDADLRDLDLSSLRMAFNGAEPVSPHTLERFAERFRPCGFRRSALMPVYGLAEAALGVTFPPVGRGPLIDRIERETFLRTGIARPTDRPEPAALPVVSCGKPIPGHAVRIVDADRRPLPERTRGRIEFQGPSATSGYFNAPAETARLFDGQWLDTGDLGYLADGELYVTGRAKDIIIRGGHNIHPQELEEAIGQLPEVRKGGVVVFPATDRRSATERVVALVETRSPPAPSARDELIARINRLAIDLIGLPIDQVVLVPPRTVLKTSSGKIRRAGCREAYEEGKLGASGRATWLQLLRLTLTGLRRQWARRTQRILTRLWGVRALTVAALLGPLAWIWIVSLPGLARRRAMARALARFAMRLSGVSLKFVEPARVVRERCVYVSNHASYLDALVMTAVLPNDVSFVAKNELEKSPVLGTLCKRLGCIFVERRAAEDAAAGAEKLEQALRRGQSLHVFPEGTFARDAGLLPFHMGAFQAAANTGAAVIPVALRGTRVMLPDGVLLPRPTPLTIIVGAPLTPEDATWRAAVELRRASRAFILAHTHELDLEQAAPPRAS